MRVNEKIPVFSGYKKYIADILLVGMFLFALVWCFWYYTIGATWWQDETYQALLCIHYLHSPVTFLSAWMGNVWMKIFGEQLLALRIYRDPEHTRRIIREYAGYYDAVAVMPEQTDCFYGESLVSEMHAVGFNLLPCGNDTSDMRIYFYVKNDILKNRRHNGSY